MKVPALLLVIPAIFGATLAIQPPRQPHQPLGNGDKLITFNETVVSPEFRATSQSIDWLSGGEDGQFIYQDDSGALILENFITGESSTFVAADAIPKGVSDSVFIVSMFTPHSFVVYLAIPQCLFLLLQCLFLSLPVFT